LTDLDHRQRNRTRTRRRAAIHRTAIGAALWLMASSAGAVGFGRISNATQLGQPLNFAAAVRLEANEILPRECVSAEVMSGDNKLQPGQIRVTLEGAADSLERSVRVTTNALIDEPVVAVSVTLGCTAKVTRRFVTFIDPPLVNLAQAAPLAALPPQRNDSQVAPLVRLVQGDTATRGAAPPRTERAAPTRKRARAPVAPMPTVAVAASPVQTNVPQPTGTRRSAAASRRASTAPAAAPGARLELEATAALAARPAGASAPAPDVAFAATAATSAARLVEEQTAQIARERARIQALEEGLASLRNDSQATQKSLGALQARLKEAEAERYANPLVYALAWLSALLALAVAGLWWRQSRMRHAAQWWAAPAPAGSAARTQGAEPTSAPAPLGATPTAANAFDMLAPAIDDDEPPERMPITRAGVSRAPTQGPVTMSPAVEPARELSVEELIDLEQQADFFVVLGQDEAAIELLMSHVRSDGGISPLPYLKLLEIYRRRGEGEAYHRIRERFNRRFNAYAPDWDSDLQQGRSLVDYPGIVERLQALWSSPVRVMETLDASLFRRNQSDETFDLPAYRELLFLYSIARDLVEHGAVPGSVDVDLLLPLNDDSPGGPISRLSATGLGEFAPSDMMTMPLDLDVSFAPAANAPRAATPEPETTPAALRRTPDHGLGESGFIDLTRLPPVPKPPKPGPSGSNR
jgi:pilus assembly protein FimV